MSKMNESKSGDSSLRDWFGKSRSSDGKPGWVQLGGKYAGKPCARQPGQKTKPKCGSSKMKRNLNKKEEDAAFRRKQRQDPNPDRKGKAINVKTEEVVLEKKGEKDACYHKVKSRYSVWPSAYASGALVKCRKVGAANWGNKTKKESFEPEAKEGITFQQFQEKCWKGYEKKGMKTMFGKRYPNCVKKEEVELDEKCWDTHKQVGMKKKGGKMVPNCVPKNESYEIDAKKHRAAQRDAKIGNLARNTSNPGEKAAAEKKSKGPKMFGEDWQKVNKSDKTDGMSQKAVNAYRRENPGSKLKTAVTGNPKKGSKDAKRRSSYCSRSEGQKKMHNIDCTKTPDKAICKARRRWKC